MKSDEDLIKECVIDFDNLEIIPDDVDWNLLLIKKTKEEVIKEIDEIVSNMGNVPSAVWLDIKHKLKEVK